VADGQGKQLTLAQLDELAARITEYYQRHGQPLSRAIVPAQTVREGVVTLEVLEARYGRVSLDNRSSASNRLLQATLAPLQAGDAVEQAKMDRALLLLSDIPGVLPSAVFKPGERTGSADLTVTTDPAQAVTANLALDNYGNRFTGRTRASAALGWANPLGIGDLLSLNLLSSGSGLNYARAAYEAVLSGQGTRLGGAYSALNYELGEELAPLQANGSSKVSSVWLRQPLLRGRDASVYAQLQYDQLRLRDHLDATTLRNDRTVDNTSVTLSGDASDAYQGINVWSVAWTGGEVDLEDAMARAADAATAGTAGSFSKVNASYARLQALGSLSALYLSLSGQWANTNLDSANKLSAGGPYSVRAYETGVLSGDNGYQATVEFRQALPQAGYGRWQATAFVDTAHLEINAQPWTTSANTARLSGAGLGLNWAGPQLWQAKASVARPIGSVPAALEGRRSTRAWFEIAKAF
jgi:hemolysin activation/secretion protein